MNLIVHQIQTDLRHFRWRLLVLWLAFAFEPFLANLDSLSGEAVGTLRFFVVLWQAFVALALIASLVQADVLVGTEAAWLTRPLRRNHLFWAKTAFLVLGLLAPRLALQIVGWVVRGYSPHLVLCAAGESLLYTVPFVFALATLAALTRDLSRFFLAIGITVGGIFAWVVVVEMLRRAGLLDEAKVAWEDRPTRDTSAVVVALLCAMACTLLAWIVQARSRLWRAGVGWWAAGLMAFPVIVLVWPNSFLRPKLTHSGPLTVTVVETNLPPKDPQSQHLSSELVVHGVPVQHVVVAQHVSADLHFVGDPKPTLIAPVISPERKRPTESWQGSRNRYFNVIRSFLPATTLWFNEDPDKWLRPAFYEQSFSKRFTNQPPAAKLDGVVEVDSFAVRKVAETPLRRGTFPVFPGRRVTVRDVQLADGAISVVLDECTALLLLDRDMNTAPDRRDYGRGPRCTYVLHHPGSGEAFLNRQEDGHSFAVVPALLSGETHRTVRLRFPYPALRERLAGVTAAEWLREARLWIFAPVYEGTSRLTFHKDDFLWSGGGDNTREQKVKLDAAEAIARAVLPDNPTVEQLEAYLGTVLDNGPDHWDDTLLQAFTQKFRAAGTKGLPALLRRLPLDSNLEYYVPSLVSQLVTRAQLAELRSALERDSELVRVFMEKHWEADARDVLVAKLRDHRQPLPPEALRIAAGARDPATYADLRWHFVRLRYGQDEVLTALEQCPGFDTAGAVREAWRWAQLGLTSGDDFATAAAKLGLPEALNRAVLNLEGSRDESRQRRDLPQLAALTGYSGPADKALTWLSANLAQFRFDAARQRYALQPAR